MKRIFAVVASFILVLSGCGLNDPSNDHYMGRSQPLVSVPEPAQDIDCDLIFP